MVRSCTPTGLPASVSSREDNQNRVDIIPCRRAKGNKLAQKTIRGLLENHIANEFESVLKEERRFAIDLDEELGGLKGESHIAVVHADGNGMGEHLDKVIDKEYEKGC